MYLDECDRWENGKKRQWRSEREANGMLKGGENSPRTALIYSSSPPPPTLSPSHFPTQTTPQNTDSQVDARQRTKKRKDRVGVVVVSVVDSD